MGLELVVKLCDAGEKEIARRENEGQKEIVDRALSGLVPINRREEEGETGRNKKVVKVVVSLSLSPRNLSRKNRKEGWKTEGGSRAKDPLDFGGRQGPLRSEIHTDDGRT